MTIAASRDPGRAKQRRFRHALAATVIGIGVSSGFGHPVAWADIGESGTSSHSPGASSSDTGDRPAKSVAKHSAHQSQRPGAGTRFRGTTPDATAGPSFLGPRARRAQAAAAEASPDINPPAAQQNSTIVPQGAATDSPRRTPHGPLGAVSAGDAESTDPASAPDSPAHSTSPDTTPRATVSLRVTTTKAELSAADAAVITPTVTETVPTAPGPLSPVAKIAALPGRIVNAALQLLGFTVSADSPKSPFDFAPVDQLLFAVFRRVEDVLGLSKTPAAQPVPPTLTYTGPTTAPTPTVAQFLNAAAAEYVLGGTPGGLTPFTVNGVQVAYTNILSGTSAKVWVTPEQQIIIAYQGTTGGTNLLFNPLIAITQLIADLQVILTGTTPWAFHDALAFERRVQAAAVEQGYDTSDIFLTGHSLGGWQAEYVAQQTGLGGIGFESPGLNTKVPGNGNGSGFINIETYGDTAAYMSTDLPGLQPFMPAYVPAGGSKPHYGAIVMIGDPEAMTPLYNSAALWGNGLLGAVVFAGDFLGNFSAHHLPGMQAYNLDVRPDPGVVPWLGIISGPVNTGCGELTIPQLKLAASQAGTLVAA